GLVDALVGDGINAVKGAMNDFIAKGVPEKHRTDNYAWYLDRLSHFDTAKQADAEQIKALFAREDK
ncbi:MAG TPA: biotin-independent malonate decarboxylase subunit beta, partial [Escherichia sp.]|nr:biotin-independent malonate decarboxylase subunit beta [Escherichia sp.]